MNIETRIDKDIDSITVVIMTPSMTDEVNDIIIKLKEPNLLKGFKKDRVKFIEHKEVIRIYSYKQGVYAVCDDGEYKLNKRLYRLEEDLKSYGFIRISHSEIINIKKVSNFDLSISGTICVKFNNGTSTYVSRRFVSQIKKKIKT